MFERGKPAPRGAHCPYSTNVRISDMVLRTVLRIDLGNSGSKLGGVWMC